jgi:7-carboxy-7-deazaguanine synthase
LGLVSLPVVETFHSLQGEGMHAGRSAFFIRLGGCTVGCNWCDTKHSWPKAAHPERSPEDLAAEAAAAAAAGAGFVVITGGEPLHHQLDGLCQVINEELTHRIGAPVPLHLETSGVDPFSGHFNWITLSPKRHNPPNSTLLRLCDELKVVVHADEDLAFALAMAHEALSHRKPPNNGRHRSLTLMVQPGHRSPKGTSLAVDFVKANPEWRLSLQTHKLLGID